eukprot:tig00000663_g2971.t1
MELSCGHAPAAAVACGPQYFGCASQAPAAPGNYGAHVWAWTDPSAAPLFLGGHRTRVSALAFNDESKADAKALLVTGSRDGIVLWDLDRCYAVFVDGGKPTGTLLSGSEELEEGPRMVSFAPDAARIAACVGREVHVFAVGSKWAVRLEGHGAAVVAARFLPGAAGRVVSAGEDREFKVWDLEAGALLFRSGVVCGSAFSALACDPERPRLALGTQDGRLFLFEAAPAPAPARPRPRAPWPSAPPHRAPLSSPLPLLAPAERAAGPRVISSEPAWRRSPPPAPAAPAGAAGPGEEVEEASPPSPSPSGAPGPRPAPPRKPRPSRAPPRRGGGGARAELVVAVPKALLRLDALSFDPLGALPPPPPAGAGRRGGGGGGPLAACALLQTSHGELSYTVACAFRPALLAGRLRRRLQGPGEEAGEELSVWPRGPLPEASPLRYELPPAEGAGAAAGAKGGAGAKGKGKGAGDKPVTFHSRIKSSGYGAEVPWSVAQAQKEKAKKAAAAAAAAERAPVGSKQYPTSCGPLVFPQENRGGAVHGGPIARLVYSGDGKTLATASADRTARTLKLPAGRGAEGWAHAGHDGPLLSCALSFDGARLLTASADCTARLWGVGDGRAEPWLVFRDIAVRPAPPRPAHAPAAPPAPAQRNAAGPAAAAAGPSPASSSSGPAGAFKSAVRAAQFYYLDRFVLLASGPRVHLYAWRVDAEPADDIRRLRGAGRYRLVKAVQLEAAQSVTALAAPNSFLSGLLFAAGSDRTLAVLDMAHGGACARLIPDAHARPVHALALRESSPFVSLPPASFDLLLSSAPDSAVRLWDLRQNRCAMRFTGHQCRSSAAPVGCAFSPCGRYVATGSEDRVGYVYEMRTGGVAGRLQGHGDVVSDVAFSPLHPQLATASFDGRIRFFSDAPS